MKRITTLIVSMLLIASSVWARTPEEAAAIASGFMSQKGTDASVVQRVQRAKSTGVAQSTVSLEYIQVTKANDNAVYVFNHTDGGFVLVSAIDNSREVLGYNDNGRFDKNNIPKNMQFWLQMYADELASVDKTATRSVSAKAATSTYTAVSPILDCTWGQSWPYNEMCPTIGSDHAVTGCVATAISQIMYAHKHPAKGTGSHNYTSETNNITSSVNFGSTTYDWNNMLPYYDWYYPENYTDAQVSAVATLLYHVGVSSNMDYGVDGSGAYSGESLYNMTEYFDYDKAINPMSKDVMPEAEILTAISNDLQLGRPVYISGSTVNDEGHAFVCDGIRQDGYLHINWGWDGYSDGYFALSALNPEDQGTGGSSDNSAFTQLVVVYSNIKPDEGGAAVSYITCDSYTRTSGNTLTLGASNVNYRLTTLMNNGLVAADGSIYYDIYNSSNQLQHSLPVMEIGLAPNYYYTNALTLAETLPSSMANGEYQLEVCYHDANGNIFPIWVAGLGELPRVAFSVSGNTAYFGEEVELNEFTIRVKKGASCDMYTSDGLYLWWWVTNQDGQLANLTLNADGWYTTTITSTASSINCLVVNTDVVNNGWGGQQQTIDYTDITGDICLEIGAPDEYNYYDIYETSCEEEFIPEVSTVPTAEDLAEYEQDGYFVACINFQGEVCNDIVFAGSYNGWATDPEDMVHFTPLEDFDGWYVAVIPVTINEEGVEANDGKPAQLANDGSFSWDYQTGDVNSWELISGSVDIIEGYSGESDLRYWSSAEPVILKSLYFKNHNSPCHVVSHEYTVNLIAPSCGGYEPAIIGSFNGWSEGVAMWLQSDGSYSYIFTDNEGGSFKFKATTDTDWTNQIQLPYVSDDGSIVWVDNSDIVLDEQTTITIDYSNGKYTLCEDVLPPTGGITYELNGGVTNDYGWMSKNDMFQACMADCGVTGLATLDELKAAGDASYATICTKLAEVSGMMALEKWDWLEAYIIEVQNADAAATALVEGTTSRGWCYALAAFFLESKRTSWPYSADFSQAGQDAAYIPTWKHAYANPTEPTGEWVLNAPYKEGHTFDGWYATADFSGEKVTTINAQTTGTLYAKWVEYIPTIAEVWAMEDGVDTKISGVVNWVRGTDVFIQDATGGFHLSCSGTKPEVGTKIVAKGTRGSLYGKPTLSGAVIESAESAEFATPIVSTLAELLADPLKYFGQRVSVQGVYVAEYDSYGNIYVADIDGANKVQGYYMMPDQSTFPVGTKVSITAVASLHWGTFEFVGDVAGIEKVSAAKKDQYEYPARYDGKYTLTNNWVISNIEGNFADNMPGSEGYVRGMAAKDGKMYFINRETQSIVVVDGETGEMLASIKITGEHLFEKENEDGTWSSTVTFPFNDIKFDQEGHCLVGALITSPNEHFMIYVVDIETGEADLLFSERLADNPDYADISCRFDAFGVAGDITTDGVIMAADATYGNWLVYRWLIVDGVVQEGEQIDCSIDIDSDNTLFWAQSGFYTASHIFPLDEKGERFYVDGYNTLPMLFDENGRLIDDFINCPYGTSVNNAEGEILNMNTGHNGLVEFQVGNEYFLLMAAGYTSSSVPSSFALYKFADADRAFSGMEPLWYLPANGMGNAGNGCRTAPVAVEVVGNKAYLYLYVNNNGYARYEFTVEGAESAENDYTIRVKKDDVSDMDLSNGLYLWWWKDNLGGQLADMTLGDDGWYTTTITTTANSINCLVVNTDVVNNGWIGQQTIDYTNITGDICLAIGAKDWLYNYNYNLYEIPCSPMEYTTEHDFEDTEANAQWRFVQNGQTNYWTIGSAAGSMDSGSNALYITSDGNNYTYNNNASSTSWAYIPVTVTAADSITFYWKGEGESNYDNLRVYLFPKGYTPIAGDIPNSAIQLGEYLSGQTDWQYFSAMAGVEGEYNLCLRWYNDGSYGEMPIAVDNMAITTPLNTTEYPLTYVLNEDGTATVVKCATDYSGNVSIPTVVTYNGTTYTVTSISENAFKECGYLTSVTIPNSVTSIGRMAFAYCWSLESVTLSENISSIEGYTFYDCNSLTSITIPNNVTYVGENAFGYCYNLSAVTFGNNVTTIDNYAFAYCWSLESVTIPASVSYIGYSTFVSCNSLNSIVVESGNTTYDSRNNCNAIIETASNTLITGCQSTIIPETVTTIGDEAFYNCDGLTTIAIPNSVTSIGYYAFANCDNLSSVDLGNGVTTISGRAFEYCYAMTSVTIPASVTEIGSWAFYDCPTIVMEGTTPPTISSSTFKSEATIFVPCTALDTYLATSVWQDLNLQGSNYTVTLSATEGGYAQITASDCATNTVTIEAYPEERYVFTQWSDGNTDNPRILTLTEDIALTAEFTILTYPVTNLVVTTNCGTAYASWESDAPWFEVAAFDANGDYVLYDIVTYKVGVSNSQPFADGEYTWQVTPMYSDIEGDYAGDAVQAPFTISADNCVDLEIHDLSYTITDETTVNLTWNSEASAYYVRLYDYQGNYLVNELIYTNSFTYTLPDMGRYWFEIQGYNEDLTQYSSWQNISFDIVYSNWEYDLNFVYGEQQDNGTWNDAYQRPILLYSEDYQTVMRIYPMPKYENSIIGTYFVENNTDNLYAGGMWGDGSYITYNGISTGAIQSGMVTIARNEENKFVVSFDLTDANGINYTNTCTIENMSGSNITDDNVTALSASQALTLTQNLPDHDLTTMPYMVNGVISRITSYDVNLYSRARFYISEDGSTTNEFYCYNTSWLNNTSFTTGDEIAEGDTVVIYGNLQNYQGTTPEIKGYVYQHFAKEEEDESCYTLTVDATEGGYVSISPEADCYEEGTEVTLTAIANEGYQFSQWNDGSTENPRTLMMNSNTTLTAEFSRLTYVITNLVITTDCGNASGTWECDAPWYDIRIMDMAGNIQASGIMNSKNVYANSLPEGNYIWWVCPMYSDTEGDYAGEAVEQAFTISLEGCIDPEIYDLTYTTTNDSIVNVTWVSEAPLFQVWMYDSFGELLNSEFLNGNNYCDTLSETGVYQFQIRSVDADTMHYTSPAYYLDINITIPETPCYTLAVNANDGGNVSVSPLAECYEAGTQVVITATPNENYEFVTWSDGNTSAQRTIVMDKDYNLTATFRSTSIPTNNYTLTLTCDEGGTVGKNPNYEYYEENSTVTIFANANEGYKFVQWSDGNTESVRSITITQNTVLHATFVVEQKEQFSLTITADEGGTVTTIPNQDTYDAGTIVAVIANANDGYEFVRWSDGITDNVRSVTMTQDITLHATFVAKQKEQYTLSLTAGEGGSVTKTPDQPSYEDGTSVDIAAIANDGYEFVTWSDGNTSAQRTIIMDRDYSFTAIFQSTSVPADYYTLILTCDEGGTVRKSPNQEHYEVNTVVTIFAQANEGYDFVRWSDGNTDSIRTITMTQNIALHAIFVAEPKPQYVVSVTASEGGTVTKTPNQELYDEGTTVIIIAQANNGYEFAEWSDGNKNSVRSILVTDHVVLQAIFVAKQTEQFTLTLTASEGGTAIKVPDQESYNAGSIVTIIAQANNGYEFVQWSDGNTENVRSITMTQDMVLHATFVEEQKEQFTLTLTAGEGGTVTKTPDQPSYAAGSVVTITAQANEGFEFVSWSDGDKNSVRDITMTQNVELHATFKRIASNYDITNLSVTSSNKRITAKWESIATRFEIVITDRNNEVEHSEKVDITDDSKVYKYTAKKLGTYTVTIKPLNASDQQIGIEDSKTVTLVMKYSLFISTENENAGTVNEEVNGDYVDGETVEIVATPKNGYRFKMWDDGDTNAKRTLVMNQDYYLTASFSRIPTYTLTISEGENGLASMAAGSYTYKENEEVTITPLPYDGYVFDHWVVNGIENTTETLTLVMTQDYSVYPVCVSKPIPTYTLTILPGEYGKANMEAGTYTYQEGEEVTLLPIADTDYLFDQWVVNDEVNTDSVLVLVMDKDYTVMPTFIPNQVGVENIYDGITILVEQWTITVEATQAQDIALYDLVGHLIEQQPHTRIASFTVPSAGLYLIRTSSGVKKVRVE